MIRRMLDGRTEMLRWNGQCAVVGGGSSSPAKLKRTERWTARNSIASNCNHNSASSADAPSQLGIWDRVSCSDDEERERRKNDRDGR